MARFDKFDAERRAAAEPAGHIMTSIETDHGANGANGANVGSASLPPKTEILDTKVAAKSPARKHKQESDEDGLSEVKDSPPPKKKKKVADHDSDAAFAAKLQAQENGRVRSTRGGGAKPTPAKKKKTPKKKTNAKVKAEDDSDLEGSDVEVKERKVNRNGGFHVRPGLS